MLIRVKDHRGAVVFEADMPEAHVVVGAERGALTDGDLPEHVGLRVYDRAVMLDYGAVGRVPADLTTVTIPRASAD